MMGTSISGPTTVASATAGLNAVMAMAMAISKSLVVQAQLPTRQVNNSEHDPEKNRHRDGHLEDDHGSLQDEIPFQRKHDDQGEEKADDGKGVEVGLEFLEPLFAQPFYCDPACQESGDKGQSQVEKDAFAHDEDIEGHFPQ
jgi:hypothetical protein